MLKNFLIKLFLMIIWPMSLIIDALKNFKSKNLLFFILIFAILLAMNINHSDSSDIYGYVVDSSKYKNVSFESIFLEKDFFYPLLSKILNNISSDFYFIACSFSIVFFYLYYKCIKVVTLNYSTFNFLPNYFLIAFYVSLPFTAFLAFRFNTALLFFTWCILEYFSQKKNKYLFLSLLSPLIHFSFLFFFPLPFVYLWITKYKNRFNIATAIFIGSIIYSNTNLSQQINTFTGKYLTESISNQVSVYASDEGVEYNQKRQAEESQKGNVFRSINRAISEYYRLFMTCIVFILVIRNKAFLNNNYYYYGHILLFLFLSFSFAVLASSVYYGNRFFSVSIVLFYMSLFFMLTNNKTIKLAHVFYKSNNWLINFASVLVIISFFNSFYMSRFIFNYINLFFGNFISSFVLLDY